MAKKKPQQIKPQPRPRDAKGRFIKATPTKKITVAPVRIKDAKKVAAGKVRAATGIKENGKYISKIFSNEVARALLSTKKIDVSKVKADNTKKINELLKEAKLTPAQVKKFYDQNKKIFDDLKTFGKIKGTSKNSNQMEKILTDYKGKIFLNDGKTVKEVTPAQAKFELIKFKNFLSSTINVVDFSFLPTFDISGEMTINLPNAKRLLKDIKTSFGVKNDEELNDFTGSEIMEVIQSLLKFYYGDEPDLTIYAS